ncbi:MAG: hypothetical protein OEY93_03620, partial [Anaerolineae bacterium]|nr:hypothetical protein [Anaerolineae bacterium]
MDVLSISSMVSNFRVFLRSAIYIPFLSSITCAINLYSSIEITVPGVMFSRLNAASIIISLPERMPRKALFEGIKSTKEKSIYSMLAWGSNGKFPNAGCLILGIRSEDIAAASKDRSIAS